MDTHEIIKYYREKQGMSQSALAELTGYKDRSSIAKIESGSVDLPQSKIALFAKAFNISPAQLMGFTTDMPAPGTVVKLPPKNAKTAPSLSDEAADVAKRYSALDSHGKTVVNMVLTEEEKRMAAEKTKKRSKKYEEYDEAGESTGRVIPLYFTPSAAGYASPDFGEDFEYIEVGGDVPPHAEYAVKIDGDSMEPYIMDGSTVYVNRDPLRNGDVGIFFFDGNMLCKQYYRDEWGNVNLLSLNRDRADADKFIEEDSGLTLACYGRVILPHPIRLAVPEEELL